MKKGAAEGTDARGVVLELLLEKGDFPTRRFAAEADHAGLRGRDRAFARELLAGVIRRRATLDAIYRPYCSRRRVDPAVAWTLRLGLYQRFFLEHVPAYAAFGATLEAARKRLAKATGFANAVLRAVDRGAHELDAQEGAPATRLLRAGERAWRFDREIFPDPQRDLAAWAVRAYSYPSALVARWIERLPEETWRARMETLNGRPPVALRVNPLRADREQVREALRQVGVSASPGPSAHALMLDAPAGDIRSLPGFEDGWWSVQDLTSQETAALAGVTGGERVLDLCAAPGGKSFAIYEASGGDAEIHACDLDASRLALVERDRDRLGHPVSCSVVNAEGDGAPPGPWDVVVLDVPCSNTGVLHKRPEARWRFDPESAADLRRVQRRIVRTVAQKFVSERTRVLWSTCSLEPEENETMATALAEEAGMRLAEARSFEPDAIRSGGYAALLVR